MDARIAVVAAAPPDVPRNSLHASIRGLVAGLRRARITAGLTAEYGVTRFDASTEQAIIAGRGRTGLTTAQTIAGFGAVTHG